MAVPGWVLEKQRIQAQEHEELEFVGELGVAGVIDGKLPNGSDYEWKKNRKESRSAKFDNMLANIRTGFSTNDNRDVPLDD